MPKKTVGAKPGTAGSPSVDPNELDRRIRKLRNEVQRERQIRQEANRHKRNWKRRAKKAEKELKEVERQLPKAFEQVFRQGVQAAIRQLQQQGII